MKKFSPKMLALVLALLVAGGSIVGGTLAWFTDSVTTGVNTITAGNLDVTLEYSDNMSNWQNAEGVMNAFYENNWEPGFTKVGYFRIKNAGSLALDYKVSTNVIADKAGTNQAGNPYKLSDYLQYGIVELADNAAAFADRAAARAAVTSPTKFSDYAATGEALPADQFKVFAMVVWMPEDTGNEANHNGNPASIQFGINVTATQAAYEIDSFNHQYDANPGEVTNPEPDVEDPVVNAGTTEELAAALETALTGGAVDGVITINLKKNFDLANNWTTINGKNYSGVNTVVINGNGHAITNMNKPFIEGVFGGSGTLTIKNLTIKDSTISAAGGSGVGIGVFVNNADASASVTFENCHIEGVKITNTADNSTLGGFIGYSSAATLTFTNCSVKSSTFTGTKDIGAFIGYTQSAVTATGVTITDNTITSSNNSTYRVGAIAGTFNSKPSTITMTDVSNNTVTQANAVDMTKKTSDYAGRIYADVTVNGQTLTKNGD